MYHEIHQAKKLKDRMSTKFDPYVHLHVHSHYSKLDGYGTAEETIAEAARLGQKAIAFTDHGSIVGLYDGYSTAKKYDLKFIAGIEAYFTPSTISHTEKTPTFFGPGGREDVSGSGAYTHLTILAENNVGLSNLYKLNLRASTEGFYKKPRMSLELLADHADGLIVTTGCPSGEVQTRLRLGQYEEALNFTAQLVDIVGRGNVYVELMEHGMTIELERSVRSGLMSIAKQLNLPLVATNDLHYAKKEDCEAHEKLLAVQTNSVMSEPPDHQGGKRFAFEGSEYYVKSAAQMSALFPERDFPGAISNTLAIAERCSIDIEYNDSLRPAIPIPAGYTESEWLRKEAYEGLERRLPGRVSDAKYLARLEMELEIIIERRYPGYFLVVSEFTRWAKAQGIPVGAGRGSAAGSLTAFVMDITDVEPIKHNLLFERFLNPERDSPPDVDMDFDDRRRPEVIDHVAELYGHDQVSQVITYGKLKAKQSLKDASRIGEHPFSVGNELTKALPPAIFGKEITLKEAFNPGVGRYDEAGDFRDKVKELNVQDVADTALSFEGRLRSTGVHAAAVIISSQPIIESVPVEMRQADGAFIAQWDYPTCEGLGLLKMDFLGLRNLGIMDDCVKLIEQRQGIRIDLDAIKQGDMDDPKTFKLLQSGNTLGVFQLDGGPMRSLLKLMKPTHFDDISSTLALYRPGPMGVNAHIAYALRKNGLEETVPIHPELAEPLEEILGYTHHLIVFQEQVMQIAQKVSGYTLAKADNLRRAMGKKKRSVLEAEYIPFRDGAKANGYSDEAIQTLWDILVPFADYSFNAAHTVGYGYISYITAYLKANYPAEYMSALLTSVADDTDKTAEYLEDCRVNGIKVLPPDVKHSRRDYFPQDDKTILFGLRAIKGIGAGSSDELVAGREKQPEWENFTDFMNTAPRTILNKRILEGLIWGGGFDSMGYTRRALATALDDHLKTYQKYQRALNKAGGQTESLFDDEEFEALARQEYPVPDIDELPQLEKLKFERDKLGLYVSAHPLDSLNFGKIANTKIVDITSGQVPAIDGFPPYGKEPNQVIAGILSTFSARKTKAGKNFGSGTLEDKTGSMDIVFFSRQFEEHKDLLAVDGIYAFTGFAQKARDGEGVSFIVNSARKLDFNRTGGLSVRVKVTQDQWERGEFDLRQRLLSHSAEEGQDGTDVIVSIRNFDGSIEEVPIPVVVRPSTLLLQEIRELFGTACIGRWRAKAPVADETVTVA